MNYRVIYLTESIGTRFIKDVSEYPIADQEAVFEAIQNLGLDPRPYGYIKLTPPLRVGSNTVHFRIRVGRYRIFYNIIDQEKIVFLLAVKRRNERTY